MAIAPGLPPITEVRLLTAAGVDLSTTGLGMETCSRPAVEVDEVMNKARHHLCPVNSLLAVGRATAELRFDPDVVYSGTGRLALYSGDSLGDQPGLFAIADSYRPLRTQLTYRGYFYIPPPGFGLGIALKVIPIPSPPFGAPVALASFRIAVGGPAIRYVRWAHGRRVYYHPRAVRLPSSCPKGGLRFRAIVRLADGRRLQADATARCLAGDR
jgi:hypothetical protein